MIKLEKGKEFFKFSTWFENSCYKKLWTYDNFENAFEMRTQIVNFLKK